MKALIFDSGPLINFALNGLLYTLKELKKAFNGVFLITEDVKYEVIDRPIKVLRFELEALRIKQLLDEGVLQLPSSVGISDAIIIAVPLMSTDENCAAINGIRDAFVATCGIGLLSLSVHVPMRAGLDVGVATQINNKEIYGPALESAFYLESKLAEYPRFLIGKELINYLLWVENQKCNTRIGEVAKETAKYCRQMVIQDTDGRYMLDFLGEKIKEASEDVIDPNLVASAFNFVIEQYKKYLKDENDKLASRYYKLLRYFQSRKSIWGID